MENGNTFPAGTKVRLGSGREGIVVRNVERTGFKGTIVRITKSVDEAQIGQTVAATADGMNKISQFIIQQPPQQVPQEEIELVTDVEKDTPEEMVKKQKQFYKEQIPFKQRELTQKQQELTKLQQMAAGLKVKLAQMQTEETAGDQFENLERLEQDEQENLEQQQETGLQQQELQQNKQQHQQQQLVQQQQLLTMQKQSAVWVRPEHANAKIFIGNSIISCDVAATPRQQASGLQSYKNLRDDKGLWFPFTNRRTTSFHMGEVKFPIDIIFIDNNHVNRIIANVQPKQMGSWSSLCTDVVEVNGGWCKSNKVAVGDHIATPLNGKKRAYSEIEKVVNTSWSAPQDARITSDKEGHQTYDTLRTITQADGDDDVFEQELFKTFPFLKSAQEHRQPDTTDRRDPGEFDGRNPDIRFRHQDLPDVSNPFGDGDPAHVDPFDNPNVPSDSDGGNGSNFGRHFHLQRGYDPVIFREEDHPHALRPSAQVRLQAPGPSTELSGVNPQMLAKGSLNLYDQYGPDWQDEDDPRGYSKISIINDRLISQWIDSLGWEHESESKLRKILFTDSYKKLLGNALTEAGKITNYDLFDSDLLLYA